MTKEAVHLLEQTRSFDQANGTTLLNHNLQPLTKGECHLQDLEFWVLILRQGVNKCTSLLHPWQIAHHAIVRPQLILLLFQLPKTRVSARPFLQKNIACSQVLTGDEDVSYRKILANYNTSMCSILQDAVIEVSFATSIEILQIHTEHSIDKTVLSLDSLASLDGLSLLIAQQVVPEMKKHIHRY